MIRMVYEVTGPRFVAQIVADQTGFIVGADPILADTLGQHIKGVLSLLHRGPPGRYAIRLMGMATTTAEVVPEPTDPPSG